MEKFKILDENLIHVSRAGTLIDLEVEHPIKKTTSLYTISLHPDWVNVIAETIDKKIILVEQWRAGTNQMSIEIPGGKIDENEEPIEAGIRELKEETGYTVTDKSKIVYLGSVDANPAIQNNKMHFVFINNLKKTKETNFDENELVYTRTYEKDRVLRLLSEGKISHAYAHLGLLKAYGSNL